MNLHKLAKDPGSHREFTIERSYNELVDILGNPNAEGDTNKTDAQWQLEDRDTGRKLVIWNYKNGPVYCQDETTLEDIGVFSAWGSKKLARELELI